MPQHPLDLNPQSYDADVPLEGSLFGEDSPAAETATTAAPSNRRTNADDVLDAVEGRTEGRRARPGTCRICGSKVKRREACIGITTTVERCTNPKCRNEVPVASYRTRIDVPPPPPNPLLLGGPYRGGPDRGVGAPPIDVNEAIHRRVAEVLRRMEDAE